MNVFLRACGVASCLALLVVAAVAVVAEWERYRSERLGLSFESPVPPTDERLVFRGELGERVTEALSVSIETPPAAVSIARIAFKEGDRSTPGATLDIRLRPLKERAPGYKEELVKEDNEAKWPYQVRKVTFKDGEDTETRLYAVIGEGPVQWLLEARQVTNDEAMKTVTRIFESAVPLGEPGR